LEHARGARDADQQHHADEKGQGVEILAGNGAVLIHHAGQEHERRAQKGDNSPVDPVQRQYGIGGQEQAQGQPEGIEAEGGRRAHILWAPPRWTAEPFRPGGACQPGLWGSVNEASVYPRDQGG